MSKREIRAKRLVAAVLLAISVQMWSAPPLWAAEASVQTETSAAGEAKETKDAKDAKAADSETGGEADAGEEETVVVPVIGYSTRSAAGSDYGVMPLADMAVDGALTGVTGINDAKFYADTHDLLLGYDAKSQGTGTVALGSDANAGGQYSTAIGASASATAENSSALGMYARAGFKDSVAIGFSSNATADNMVSFGVTEIGGRTWTTRRSLEGIANIDMEGALTGVTGINGSELVVDKVNNNFFIGTTEYDDFDKKSKNRAVIGLGILADPYDNISVFGTSAEGRGESASAFGYDASADEFASVFGSGANAASNGSAFGYNAEAVEQYASAFGSGAVAGDNHTIAFGYSAKSAGSYSIAVGSEAIVEVARGIAIGTFAHIEKYEGYADSGNIAIGTEAHTNALYSMAIGDCADSTFKNSIAIGASSNTTAENQVSFGTGVINTINGNEVVTWTDRRSLAGISDIEMAGALTGVTSINGSVLAAMNEDVTNKSLAIGAGAVFMDPDSSVTTISKNAIAIGNGTKVLGDGSLAIGYYAYQRVGAFAGGIESIAINGWVSLEANYNIAIGGSVVDADNVVAIGYNAASDSSNAVAIGSNTYASYDGTALGYAAQGTYHNAVAIGAYSGTTEENQVSFGHKVGDRNYADGSDYSDDLFRSLVNVADIDMHGNISLGGEWKENTTSGLYESNGKGELNGVTSINGVIFAKDSMNNQEGLLIGTPASGTSFYGDASVMIGLNIDNSAIDAVGIGNYAKVRGDGSVAIGYGAEAMSNMAMYPTAIGFFARAIGDEVVAIGGSSYAVHEFSVALGDDSSTSAENQVSFGHKAGDKYGDGGRDIYGSDLFRSLVNVADIEMHGALTGVTGIDGVTVSGTDASTGLTVGGNAVIGKTDTPFSSTGFAVAKDGAVTAKTVNGATITGTGFNGVTLSTDGKVNGAAITSNSFNGVKLEKGADSHYKVGGVDVTKMQTDVAGKADAATVTALDTRVGKSETDIGTLKTTVGDSSKGLVKDTADLKAAVGDSSKGLVKQVSDVDTAYKAADTVLQGRAKTLEDKTAGISRSGSTTTLETNTSVSSSGITTNKATVSGATATTLENGKLTVGAAAVQNTGFAVGSSSLNNGSLTIDGNNKLTTAGLTASKVTVGAVTVSGGKVSGLTDAALSAVSTEAVTGKQLNATNTTVSALDTAYKAADTQIRTDFAAADTTLQNNIDAKVAQTAYDTKMSDLDSADTALSGRATALETKTAKFNTAGDNLTGMANITSTAATLGGVGFASAGVMTGVASIDGIAIDASRNLSNAGTYNGVTVAAAGISGTSVFNGAAITNNSFNGVTLEKGADNHYKVGGVDVSALKTTVDSISADGVGTADTAGIKRDTTGTATTTIETNTKISSSGITTNKATVSGATATTLENGKLTVGAATVQNTGFAVGSSSLNNGSLTVDGNNKLTTAGLTASKVTVGTVTVSGGKVSGLTDAALSAVSTEAVTGKQLNATNTTVSALDTAYKAADTQIRTDFAAADTALKTELNTAIDEKAKKATDLAGYGITDAYTKTAADEKITAATADMATKTQVTADIGTAKTALESAYQAADTALSNRAAALETAATGMSYDAGKNTTTFTGGVTATVLTAGEFKVGATGFGFGNDGALTAKTVNGIEIKKDESKVMVGGIDLTALSNGDVVTDNTKGIGRNQDTATTTIETNTAISSSGITTNAVTASGTVKAGEFVEGSQKLSDKYAAKTALADYTTTTDMNTKFADYATTTAVDTKLADYAKSDSVYSKAAADTAFAKAGDVDTLKTTVGDTDGGLVKDVKDLQSGKADKATTLAGYGIADAYTQTEINEKIVEATKDLATSATVTDIQSGLEEVTGKTAGLSYDTASGSSKFSGSVVIGNEGAKTHTQITDDAIIFGEGTDKQVTVDASGIHVGKKAAGGIALYADADGTHIDHTSLVTGSVTADNLNGVAISGNATDGLSVGGVSIKALSERLDSLEQDGVATADMGGIKRTDVVENSGKTIIEDTTSFTKDGLKTANMEAATAALGGVNFAAGAVTGVSSINGVVFGSDGKIGGVSLSGGKVDGVDVGWLDQRVKSLEDNGTGGGGTGGGGSSANTSGIHKPDSDTTNIEGNTSITTDGIDTNKVNASDSIVVADGEKNKTVISKDGILVAEG